MKICFIIWRQNSFTKEQSRECSVRTTLLSLNPSRQQVGLPEADVVDPCPHALHLEHLAPLISLEICGNAQEEPWAQRPWPAGSSPPCRTNLIHKQRSWRCRHWNKSRWHASWCSWAIELRSSHCWVLSPGKWTITKLDHTPQTVPPINNPQPRAATGRSMSTAWRCHQSSDSLQCHP